MTRLAKILSIFLLTIGLASCDETQFQTTWQDPQIHRVNLRGSEVAAVLVSPDESIRRPFERDLAKELRKYGIEGVPSYQLTSSDATEKDELMQSLRASGVDYAIVMRILGSEKETRYVPGSGSSFFHPYHYDPFWGAGFHYDPGYFVTDTFVSVETVLHSVPDNQVLFTGLSQTMNPSEVDDFVEEIVEEAAEELALPELKEAE